MPWNFLASRLEDRVGSHAVRILCERNVQILGFLDPYEVQRDPASVFAHHDRLATDPSKPSAASGSAQIEDATTGEWPKART